MKTGRAFGLAPLRYEEDKLATKSKKADEILVATESFSCDMDGVPVTVNAGHTRVRGNDPLVKRYPQWFKPVDANYDVEQTTAAPGEKRAR